MRYLRWKIVSSKGRNSKCIGPEVEMKLGSGRNTNKTIAAGVGGRGEDNRRGRGYMGESGKIEDSGFYSK